MPYKDKEKSKLYHRAYMKAYMTNIREQQTPEEREEANLGTTAWRGKNPAKRLMYCTKQSAKKRGLEHNITEEDIPLVEFCPLLGIPIDYSAGNGKNMAKPSVDRIDPTKGYVKGNVELMSTRANTMKCNASREELIRFAKNILKRYENRGD